MSAPFRDQLTLLHEQSLDLLENQKTFQIPPNNVSISQFHSDIRNLIAATLEIELEYVSEAISDISSTHDKWITVRANMTGNERTADTPLYENFSANVPYLGTLYQLKKYQKDLRSSRQKLISALPDPSQPTQSHMHLPKISLPKFSGNCIEYVSFWNSFCAGVHDLPTISNSVKFSYLKECLSGPALLLVKSLPLTDASYNEAIRLLKENYGQPEEINRNLHTSLRKLPIVHSNHGPDILCKELASFVDEFEIIYLQMLEQHFDANTLSIQMELESKLPPPILEEILKAKEAGNWTTDKLRTLLKTILKRKLGVCAIRDQNREVTPPQRQVKPNKFFTPSPSISDSYSPQNQSNQQSSSLSFATQRKEHNKFSKPPIVPRGPCLFCEDVGHFSSNCLKFPDLNSRLSRLRIIKKCFKCLKSNHFANNCPSPSKCTQCFGTHPRPLCPNNTRKGKPQTNSIQSSSIHTHNQIHNNQISPLFPISGTSTTNFPNHNYQPYPIFNPYFYQNMYGHPTLPLQNLSIKPATTPQENESESNPKDNHQINVSTSTMENYNTGPILLKCVRAKIFNPNNPTINKELILLLDDASTNSYIRTDEAKSLKLALQATAMNLGVFNNPQFKPTLTYSTTFGIQLLSGRTLQVRANTLDHLTHKTSYLPYDPNVFQYNDLIPAIKSTYPTILLGSDFYYDIEPTPICKLPSGYNLIQTLLGPIVAGKSFKHNSQKIYNTITNVCIQNPPFEPNPDFFTLEGIGITDPSPTLTEDEIFQKFKKEIRFINNRYEVKFPFKADPSTLSLPSNYGLCYGRLRSALKILNKDPLLLSKYNDIIQEQLKLGIIEPVNNPKQYSLPLHYLPHQPVITHKLRIVYDGSAHIGKENSLNDTLEPGPVILPDLVGILLRFRFPPIVIITDVMKAFLQISVNPSHRDATRFIWLKSIEEPLHNNNLQIYRFTRVPFGLCCSPFLLGATILHHLSQFPSPLSDEISANTYVDNIVFSAQEIQEAQKKVIAVNSLFLKANLELQEFASNSKEALDPIPESKRLQGPNQKILGLCWNTDSDLLKITIHPFPATQILTKRTILAFIASHFDPLGLITPLLLPLKIFMQKLWENKFKWDDPLPTDLAEKWHALLKEWTETTNISIPRLLSANYQYQEEQQRAFSQLEEAPLLDKKYQLHCFTDASEAAMCAAIFIRSVDTSDNKMDARLIFSKTKVKPIKSTKTIPILELIAIVMGVKALKFVQSHLSNVDIDPTLNLWSDSSVAISWINTKINIRDIFVSNRIKSIHKVPNLIIRHVSGQENPSDLGTRGISSTQALSSNNMWWNGPPWLSLPSTCWPGNKEVKPFLSNEYKGPKQEEGENPIFAFTVTQTQSIFDLTRHSRVHKALRTIAYVIRFISCLNPKSERFPIPNEKYPSLKISIIEYRRALNLILLQEQRSFPPTDKDNEALGIFTDNQNLLRSKGRLGKSSLPISTVEPIYLPPSSQLTALITYETHLIYHHASPLFTLSILRRNYWIPRGRKTVERILFKSCFPCRKFQVKPFDPPPFLQLPIDRVSPSRPFLATGLDYCGPLHIRTDKRFPKSPNTNTVKTKKFWVVVWVCLSTRAILLDYVPDQTSEAFLLAFRRFCSKFSPPNTIYSDSAPTFISFKKFFENLLFPHISKFDTFLTTLTEIESCVNSRPISFCSANPADPLPLRPIDFLRPLGFNLHNWPLMINKETENDPDYSPHSNPSSLENLWKKLSKTTKHFWTQWRDQYLVSLRERFHKISSQNSRWPRKGELVLIHSESPKALWPIAVIDKINYNEGQFPDTARIKVSHSGNILIRSVSHLYPLETTEEIEKRNSQEKLITQQTKENKNPSKVLQLRNRAIVH
ncbi:hypothetical protein ACQ4LE_004969 [Meloidogyne hapla]